jgi:predicted nucleotide-binding protein (sugar kinase/HSP70/actin superfamily)
MFEYKLELLEKYMTPDVSGSAQHAAFRGKIGIPLGLNMYELLPFWHTILTGLGFEVVVSPTSNRKMYLKGQLTIPSDTVCFPAKLLHGHVDWLIGQGLKTIFYPCLTYNFDESLGDNHYNCPVVAYYPEVIGANVPELRGLTFIHDYLGIHRPRDFERKFAEAMRKYYPDITDRDVRDAVRAGYREYASYMKRIRNYGEALIKSARERGKRIVVLVGRPYHIDPEINHGIDRIITAAGAVVITEDAVSMKESKFDVKVLNQWTYHSRLYAAAKYVTEQPDMELVQLVSFGCGVDAITTDETRAILESHGRIYTQIKIDEITNLGAVKIRLRSLFAATE